MKKLLALSAVALAFSAAPALADHHGGEGRMGGKGDMFAKHDTDGNGVVTEAEFLEHAKERFSKMDTDGNGEVTKDEAEAMKEKWKEKRAEMKAKKSGAPSEE